MSIESNEYLSKLKKIGDALKKKREDKSYTLSEIAETTRIHISALKNIEEGNLDELPGLVFVRGFIRNYAKILEIECDWMIDDVNYIYIGMNKSYDPDVNSDKSSTFAKETSSPSSSLPQGKSFLPYLLVGAVILLGIIVFFFTPLGSFKKDNSDTISSTSVNEELKKNVGTGENTIESVGVSKKIEELEKTPISPFTLLLRAKRNGWIRLTVDEQLAFDFLVQQGKDYKWPAQEKYKISLSKGNLATIFLNNEEIEIEKEKSNSLVSLKLDKFALTRLNN